MSNLNRSNGIDYQAVEPELHPQRWLWWLLGAAILVGAILGIVHACALGPERLDEATPEVTTPHAQTVLQCGDHEVQFTLDNDTLHSTIGGESFTLPNVVSADGSKYSDGHTALWESHGVWSLIRNEGAADEEVIECVAS